MSQGETRAAVELARWQHSHAFGTDAVSAGEQRTRWVVAITLVMMVAEIVAGTLTGSMALLADGWHMGTHAAALSAAIFAYVYARRHANDRRFSFGTGKVGALGGFASAVGLAVVALAVLVESIERLTRPIAIHFDQAIGVAVIGLAVNLVSALILGHDHDHDGHAHHDHDGHDHDGHAHHDHDHDHDHDGHAHHDHDHHRDHGDHAHAHHHRDHNLRAAYLHVLADALTSVLAIIALVAGKFAGWTWMDAAMGVVGSLVIARWSLALLRDTSRVLLDAEVDVGRQDSIRAAIESDGLGQVADLHIWRVGRRHLAAIVAVVTDEPQAPDAYKARLAGHADLVHVTVEVNRREPSAKQSALPGDATT